MKQFTTEEQTQLLRSVGCPEPKGTALTEESKYALMPELEPNYSIGELMEALDELCKLHASSRKKVEHKLSVEMGSTTPCWIVNANDCYHAINEELIDALAQAYVDLRADYVESKYNVC